MFEDTFSLDAAHMVMAAILNIFQTLEDLVLRLLYVQFRKNHKNMPI